MFNKTVTLSGEDSINMANNLFRPSQDYIESHNAILDNIRDTVHVTENDRGFSVVVDNLDLSFLRESNNSTSITECFSVEVRSANVADDSNHNMILDGVFVGYNSAREGGLVPCAA